MKGFVLADDLTGGCDVGLMFTAQGLRVCVLPTDEGLPALGEWEAEVMVLDTESRALPQAEASQRVKDALGFIRKARGELIYKKIDRSHPNVERKWRYRSWTRVGS